MGGMSACAPGSFSSCAVLTDAWPDERRGLMGGLRVCALFCFFEILERRLNGRLDFVYTEF